MNFLMNWPVWFWGTWDAPTAAISQANAAWFQLPVSIVAAAVTAWAAVGAWRAALAAEKATALGQETARLQLRAYVSVASATFNYKHNELPMLPNAGETLVATIRLKNNGLTPALELSILAQLCVRELPLKFDTLTRNEGPPDSKVDLGSEIGTNCSVEHPIPVNEQSKLMITQNKWGIFLIGEARYRDVFGDEHQTNFCLFNSPKCQDGTMTFFSLGNSAT